MKRNFLKGLIASLIMVALLGVFCISSNAQIITPENLAYPYCGPTWFLTAFGSPWWTSGTAPVGTGTGAYSLWPQYSGSPYYGNMGIYSMSGFNSLMTGGFNVPGASAGLSMYGWPAATSFMGYGCLGPYNFPGLGVTSFGAPNASTSLGYAWNWSPYFGLTSMAPSMYNYAGIPWWSSSPVLQ